MDRERLRKYAVEIGKPEEEYEVEVDPIKNPVPLPVEVPSEPEKVPA